MKNRVARLVEIGKIEIFEEELPPLQKDEVLVAIKSVGICGSDIHYFLEGGLGSFKQKLPMEMGHEPSGVVVDSLADGEFNERDRVTIEPGRACFFCSWCVKGKHNLCENVKFMGANAPGALADYVIVHRSQLAKIPAKMSYKMAALLEPLGIGLHAANLIQPKNTESVVIFGAGPIGLCLMKILQKAGMSEIYMIDILPYRVKFAEKMGATKAFLFRDAIAEIKKLTNNRGTTYTFDAAGAQDSITACGELVSVGGTIGLIGIPTDDFIKYNPHRLRTKEIRIQNVRRSNQTMHDCVKLFSNDFELEKIITHSFDFKDVQKGFDLVSAFKGNVIKCVITND
ncbi:MAG: alcohol dehydrogenase catalytic domain-containing protein [Patescibacteria group bacterium]